MSIMEKFSSAVSGLMILVIWLGIGWGEIGGTLHAFKKHGVRDGFAAVFVPPWAWYRGLEFFWHKNAKPEGGASPSALEEEFPPLNVEEVDTMSRVIAKAQREPLGEADLNMYKQMIVGYGARTNKPVSRRDLDGFLELARLGSAYHRELGRCLLSSIDQKKPFISTELERLRDKIKEAGLMRTARLEADFRNIDSAAYGTTFTDDLGHQHYPPSRGEVLEDLKEDDIMDENFRKLAVAMNETLSPSK